MYLVVAVAVLVQRVRRVRQTLRLVVTAVLVLPTASADRL
jgi:hypothetical protein